MTAGNVVQTPAEPTEVLLRGLLAAAPDALIAVEPSGSIVFVNDQAERLFGWARRELAGKSVELLVPEGLVLGHPALRAGYVAHPTHRPMAAGLNLSARRRDGTQFPAEISLSAFTTSEGTLVAAAIRDVTVARQTEHRFRAVLESAPDATIGVDVNGRIELVNAQVERLFGWRPAELIGKQIEMLVPGAVGARHVRHRAVYLASPRPRPMGAGLQLAALCKDGTTFPVEISLSTVVDDAGAPMVLAAVRDIRERIQLAAEQQRRAVEAEQFQSHKLESLGQLAGGVAHDFNNLLGVILNYATLMSPSIDDPIVAADLAEIRAAAERGAALTAQLLTFARRDVVERAPHDVAAIVRSVAAMLARTLGEHLVLRVEIDDTPLLALCDRGQFEQILMNLVINARDAMADGGVLTLGATRSSGSETTPAPVVLTVTDTGHGMTAEVVGRAFEPFFTTKPRGRGTGLGLATVYGIVRQNGGDLSVASVVGEGTVVTVSLPGTDQLVMHEAPRRPVTEAVPGGDERILLVEDEVALRAGTARLLEHAGYQVVVATDGMDALEIFDRRLTPFHLILTDIAMPRMRGDELAMELRLRVPDLPVILMTGYDSGATPLTGRVLAKPVVDTQLLRAVRAVLDD